MLKNWLSRYRRRYPRSLIYMLQASEYNVRDYLFWYHQTSDFTHVEYRKQFVRTAKGLLLLAVTWAMVICSIILILYAIWHGKFVPALLLVIITPIALPYLIIIPLFLIKIIIQWPTEFIIVKSARHKLTNHKTIKIGIAGSFGKTSMREILTAVLSEGKVTVAPPHSYNTLLGISQFIRTLKGNEEVIIFELGEYYPGDVKKLCDLTQPDIGVITGINEAHLQKFRTLERTVGTIYELADYLGEKAVYVNGENELARKNARGGHVIYDRRKVGDWQISNERTDLGGTAFTITKGNTKLELSSSLLGLHQVGPLAVSVQIALNLGLTPEQIKAGVAKTRPFDHRLEPRIDAAGVITLDDSYNGNPDGVRAVIEFLSSLQNCRRFYVTPGLVEMGSKVEEVHKDIGRSLARAKIEKVILIKNSITSYIAEGLQEGSYRGEVIWFEDALSAFSALPHMTVKGDVVLLQNDWPDQYH